METSDKNNVGISINDRQSGVEVLRIICMLWIVLFHFTDHGTVDMFQSGLSFNWVVLAFAKIGGGLGNCVFALISGYFLSAKTFRASRLIRLWLEVEFYSIVSYFVALSLDEVVNPGGGGY